MTANELRNINFPECSSKCDLIKILGCGECENIECCKHKFDKEKIK